MSNLGLIDAMKESGINVETTAVGDRYVIEKMKEKDYNLGGEQSGHIIFMDYATTGDGIISGLHVLKTMINKQKDLAELASFMKEYPQKLTNFDIKEKPPIEDTKLLKDTIIEAEKDLDGRGRTMVRYSGTENKIRILVEAKEAELVEKWTQKLSDAVEKELC
jgi:phosphoglucosamine mutase